MSKIYALYGPDERRIDNLKRRIRGYEKMRKDLTNQNRKLNKKNRKYKEVIDKAINKLGIYADKMIDNGNAYAICVDLLHLLKEVE